MTANIPQASVDTAFAWTTTKEGGFTVHAAGRFHKLNALLAELDKAPVIDLDAVDRVLLNEFESFALIIEGPDVVLAAVDRIRGYPAFYSESQRGGFVSNNARFVTKSAELNDFDGLSVLEFSMSGYVSGPNTLIEGVHQLQAGERIAWIGDGNPGSRRRYYEYKPIPQSGGSTEERVEILSGVVDRMIARTIKSLDGAPVWMPLSGGLDCRLILCKLLEHGYDNIQTFSYGIRGNNEAVVASEVAKILGVPWRHVAPNARRARRLFNDGAREQFWNFADGLASIPSLREFEAFSHLKNSGVITDDAVIINGQSGDYLTGGHVKPGFLADAPMNNLDDMSDQIQAKHYSLWSSLKTTENQALIRDQIFKLAAESGMATDTPEQLIALYEYWEWQERQCKYVCNGQRTYDYLGLDWLLPLWDGEFMDFWETVPYEEKVGQSLYMQYLRDYDYKGMFKDFKRVLFTFPTHLRWIFALGRIIGLIAGANTKDKFYRKMSYFGSYHHQYALMGFKHYLSHADMIRGPISLLVETWLRENGIDIANLETSQLLKERRIKA